MTYKELQDFIETEMRMSHIYQPLLIKTLVESEGISTTRRIALEFLKYDESQIQYYERIVKTMPVKVLLSHDVIKKENNQKILEELYDERKSIYKLANHKIECDKLSKGNIAEKIIVLYEKY